MDTIINSIVSTISYVGPFILLMGTLVFLHELGHFSVAKFFGVRVEVFSLGFGKTLLSKVHGDTTYKVCLIPLGGYVKMFGDDPSAEISEEEKKHSFLHKPVSQRIAVVLAGPLMNLFIAIPIFGLILLTGLRAPSPQLGDIAPGTFAHEIGMKSGDTITKVGSVAIESWDQLEKQIRKSGNQSTQIELTRLDGTEASLNAKIPEKEDDRLFTLQDKVGKIEGMNSLSKSSLVGIKIGSILHKAGVNSLDQITQINDFKIKYFRDIEPSLQKVTGQNLTFTIKEFNLEKETKARNVSVLVENIEDISNISKFLGIESTSAYILGTTKDSPASKAGLKMGDKITAINGQPISNWDAILVAVKGYKPESGDLKFTLENTRAEYGRNIQGQTLAITPKMTQLMNRKLQDENRFTVGIYSDNTYEQNPIVTLQTYNPVKLLKYGVEETIAWTKLTASGIYKLATNQVSKRNLTGIITIGKVAGDSFKVGIDIFLKIMGVISVNLFLLNLLPIPVLDGGHLVFYAIEIVKGSPLSVQKMQMAQQVGFLLLMSLMVFAFYNDIMNLINPPF